MRATCIFWTVLVLVACFILGAGCVKTPATETGTLQFSSSPAGAEVYFDGQYRGTTPVTLAGVAPGSYPLEYRLSGYTTWIGTVEVAAGPSQFSAALSPVSTTSEGDRSGGPTADTIPEVTLKVSKETMILGDSMVFSGTAKNTGSVLLTLYGPGSYSQGVLLTRIATQVKPNAAGLWSYTWTPGTRIQSGSYTIIARDDRNISSSLTNFRVIGGGVLTVVPSRYTAAAGSTITFSGRCTTGADSVRLVVLGPGLYSTGIELGIVTVNQDTTWSYKFLIDRTLSTGTYTITVYDVPKTTTASSQFTVGYIS